jgi:membrane-associated phospholipid phosphatase
MVAREFAQQHESWTHDAVGPDDQQRLMKQIEALIDDEWIAEDQVRWWGWDSPTNRDLVRGWAEINSELEALVTHMSDSRAVYLAEARAQAPAMRPYFVQLLGIDPLLKPWTNHLMRCATAVAHIAYMYFKGRFKRVRPSILCPGLAVPFGPPQHPAFPSGHSTAAHLVALCLLQIPEIAERYGVVESEPNGARRAPNATELRSNTPPESPLLWLADRIGRNRERIGVHYSSDSRAGRHIAIRIWESVFDKETIVLPTLQRVVHRAEAEWRRS